MWQEHNRPKFNLAEESIILITKISGWCVSPSFRDVFYHNTMALVANCAGYCFVFTVQKVWVCPCVQRTCYCLATANFHYQLVHFMMEMNITNYTWTHIHVYCTAVKYSFICKLRKPPFSRLGIYPTMKHQAKLTWHNELLRSWIKVCMLFNVKPLMQWNLL